MKTEQLIQRFSAKCGNPNFADLQISEENNRVILIFEGIAKESFPLPNDWTDYLAKLNNES